MKNNGFSSSCTGRQTTSKSSLKNWTRTREGNRKRLKRLHTLNTTENTWLPSDHGTEWSYPTVLTIPIPVNTECRTLRRFSSRGTRGSRLDRRWSKMYPCIIIDGDRFLVLFPILVFLVSNEWVEKYYSRHYSCRKVTFCYKHLVLFFFYEQWKSVTVSRNKKQS